MNKRGYEPTDEERAVAEENRKLEKERDDAYAERDAAVAERDNKQKQVQDLKIQLNAKTIELQQTKKELAEVKEKLVGANAGMRQTPSGEDDSEEVKGLKEKIEFLESKIKTLESEKRKVQDESNVLSRAILSRQNSESTVNILEPENRRLRSERDTLTRENTRLTQEINSLKGWQSQKRCYSIWGHIWKGLAVLLDVIAIWLFVFCSLKFITTTTIMLVVFLTLVNLLILAMRILHCISEFTQARFDTITLPANIFGSICLLAVFILIILVFGVGL